MGREEGEGSGQRRFGRGVGRDSHQGGGEGDGSVERRLGRRLDRQEGRERGLQGVREGEGSAMSKAVVSGCNTFCVRELPRPLVRTDTMLWMRKYDDGASMQADSSSSENGRDPAY